MAAVGSGSSGPAFVVTEGLPEDARFEIGSITKTMTAALLASLVGDGVLALDDEIGRWLDAGPNGNITLEQLATHTSGLPRLAPNQPTDEANPYRDFTAECAEEGLRTATRARRAPVRTSGISSSGSCWSGPAVSTTRTCWRNGCSGRLG